MDKRKNIPENTVIISNGTVLIFELLDLPDDLAVSFTRYNKDP